MGNGNGKVIGRAPVAFVFDEMQYRGIAAQVKADAERLGGAMPMPDPAGFLCVGVILDKLGELAARLDKLEAIEARLAALEARPSVAGITLSP